MHLTRNVASEFYAKASTVGTLSLFTSLDRANIEILV